MSFATGHYPICFLHFSFAWDLRQGIVDWDPRQMSDCIITDESWLIEKTVKVFCPAFKNPFPVGNQ